MRFLSLSGTCFEGCVPKGKGRQAFVTRVWVVVSALRWCALSSWGVHIVHMPPEVEHYILLETPRSNLNVICTISYSFLEYIFR